MPDSPAPTGVHGLPERVNMSLPPMPSTSTQATPALTSTPSSSSALPPRPAHLPAPPKFTTAMPDHQPHQSLPRDTGDRYVPAYHVRESRDDPARREGGGGGGPSAPRDQERKRRRSPSPVGRGGDRQDGLGARHRYEDSRDSPRHSAPRPQMRPIGPDPDTLEHLVSYVDWVAWYRAKHPDKADEDDAYDRKLNDVSKPKKAMERYEAYKKRFISRQLYGLFLYHKGTQWFQEKYSPKPEFAAERERIKKLARKGKEEAFLAELGQEGAYVYGDDSWGLDEKRTPAEEANGGTESAKNDANGQALIPATPAPHQVFIKTIPPNISRAEIEKICAGVDGFVSLILGPPQEKKNFHRVGWVNFVEGTDMTAACNVLDGSKVADPPFTLHMCISEEAYVSRPKYAPVGLSRLERLEKDLAQARKLAQLLEDEGKESVSEGQVRGSEKIDELGREADALVGDGASIDQRKQLTKYKLDLFILYLRRAFFTCYYSASINDSVEELERRSIRYYRRVPVTLPAALAGREGEDKKQSKKEAEDGEEDGEERKKEAEPMVVDEPEVASDAAKGIKGEKDPTVRDLAASIFEKDLDGKLSILFNRSTLDPAEVGGKNIDEEITRITLPHIKQEAEGKFRCKACNKLFKGPDFLKKHIPTKHPDLVKDLDNLPFFNNFVLDPLHLAPPPNAPASVNNQPPAGPRPIVVSSLPSSAPPPWMNPSLPLQHHHQHPSTGYTPGFVGFNPPPGGGVFNPSFRPIAGRGGMPPMPRGGVVVPPSLMDRVGAMVPGEPEIHVPGGEMLDTTLGRPEGMKDDPRAKRGRVSYNDLDSNVEDAGDPMLNY